MTTPSIIGLLRHASGARPRFAVPAAISFLALVLAAPAAGAVPVVTATITVGTDPYGVAVNPVTGTVYIANGSGTVSVMSGRTGTVTATIPVTGHPQGIAVNPLTGTVYVANEVSGTVTVISGSVLCHRS
jgi:YVTN family beta-propeller protein